MIQPCCVYIFYFFPSVSLFRTLFFSFLFTGACRSSLWITVPQSSKYDSLCTDFAKSLHVRHAILLNVGAQACSHVC